MTVKIFAIIMKLKEFADELSGSGVSNIGVSDIGEKIIINGPSKTENRIPRNGIQATMNHHILTALNEIEGFFHSKPLVKIVDVLLAVHICFTLS